MTKLIMIFFLLSTVNIAASEEKALTAIKALGKNLKHELQTAIKSKGEVHALEVCNTKAMQITEEAKSMGIDVGRVSLKNRNPSNKPQKWMGQYIKEFHAKKIKKSYVVVNISNKKNGLLMPIKTMPVCLKCHGDNVKSSTLSKINELYPSDKAIGYKVGEIRGFFWATYNK